MPEKPAKRYRVANPRGIPATVNGQRIPICRIDGRAYFEGDEVEFLSPPSPRFTKEGFLVEVKP